MNDDESFREVVTRRDDLEAVPIGTLFDLVTREGTCMGTDVATTEPAWRRDTATDRELAAHICAGRPVGDECLELEFRTAGFTTLGVGGALADDDRRTTYLAAAAVSTRGSAMKPQHCAPLETEPVSGHAPGLSDPLPAGRVAARTTLRAAVVAAAALARLLGEPTGNDPQTTHDGGSESR